MIIIIVLLVIIIIMHFYSSIDSPSNHGKMITSLFYCIAMNRLVHGVVTRSVVSGINGVGSGIGSLGSGITAPDQGSRAMESGSAVFLRDQGSGCTTFVGSGTKSWKQGSKFWLEKWDQR